MMNNNLLLFGLSADMLHNGHVAWIATLRKEFPNHTLVIMPCCSNPLGKKDESGKIIYPSNAFIRWQMLFDYFQKHDPEIIVSQYEVAINIPSKTYTTINYLQNTTINEIKAQRGYILPVKYKETPINSVSIAIGTDIINELDKWYEWEKILKTANIIVMHRAGFGEINLEKIKNTKLKDAISDGLQKNSIVEVTGPQINISSRQLKQMLQNGTKDSQLLEFIPKDILTYIRKHHSEFSSAYYQNPKAQKLYELAMQIYKKTVQEFDLKRSTKLSAFISDLSRITNIDKLQTEGYKLTNGHLDIALLKLNHLKFDKQIKKWMQQSHSTWYQTNKPSGLIISPHNFNANFKLLGKYGPNLAVDLIIFIQEDNKLKLLTIKRNDNQKTLAIPGGFFQGDILTTALHELLEECFSNKLFTQDSPTNKLIDKLYQNDKNLLFNKLKLSLKDLDISINLEKLLRINPSAIVDLIINTVSKHYQNSSKHIPIISQLKCDIYMHLLPDNYQKLKKFIKEQGIISPEEQSITDQRNTNLAWIVTKSVRFLITKEQWDKLLKESALELSGGDDAASAAIMPLEKFCTQDAKPFALHKYLILLALAKFYEENKISLKSIDIKIC